MSGGGAPAGPRIAVVVKGYPRLSETFIAQELLGLEARGIALHIHSLRAPYDPATHPIHDEIAAPVSYLPEYLWHAPLRVQRGWRHARRLPGYRAAWKRFRADWQRDRTPNRVRRFGQACVLAAELDADTDLLYAHFLHTPASVTRYAATMLGLPFAISAHAKDIWTTPEWDIAGKLTDMAWLTTCTRAGADHLREIAGARAASVHLRYHGLDFARFPRADARPAVSENAPVRIVSVGRLVAKKGYDDLLDALAVLDIDWRLEHIGGGELAAALHSRAERLGIADRIDWRGRQPQSEVRTLLAQADIFVLASKIAPDGDRDGLPNVLLEAQSMGIACVATDAAGIPELITHDETGLLVRPGDPAALAGALRALATDPARRATLAAAGARSVRERFDMNAGLDAIAADLRDAARGDAAPARAAAE